MRDRSPALHGDQLLQHLLLLLHNLFQELPELTGPCFLRCNAWAWWQSHGWPPGLGLVASPQACGERRELAPLEPEGLDTYFWSYGRAVCEAAGNVSGRAEGSGQAEKIQASGNKPENPQQRGRRGKKEKCGRQRQEAVHEVTHSEGLDTYIHRCHCAPPHCNKQCNINASTCYRHM